MDHDETRINQNGTLIDTLLMPILPITLKLFLCAKHIERVSDSTLKIKGESKSF